MTTPIDRLRRVVERLDEMSSPEGVDAINDLEDVAPELLAVVEAARAGLAEAKRQPRGMAAPTHVGDEWYGVDAALYALDRRLSEVLPEEME